MILLDTHVIWWLAYQPEKLSTAAADTIQNAHEMKEGIALSCASLYELVWLLERRRLIASEGWSEFLNALQHKLKILPIDENIAIEAARIQSPFHGDPMDRLIVATALASNRTLVTADKAILSSGRCQLLW